VEHNEGGKCIRKMKINGKDDYLKNRIISGYGPHKLLEKLISEHITKDKKIDVEINK
jgi:hypothetical protein